MKYSFYQSPKIDFWANYSKLLKMYDGNKHRNPQVRGAISSFPPVWSFSVYSTRDRQLITSKLQFVDVVDGLENKS